MGSKFKRLTKQEQSAVTKYAKWEFDKLILLQPGTSDSRKAQSDPEGWQEKLREFIAGDKKQVATIMDASMNAAETNTSDRQQEGSTFVPVAIVVTSLCLMLSMCSGVARPEDALAPGDPIIAQVKAEAEKIRRCNEMAQALWDGLTQDQRDKVRLTLSLHPSPDTAMPSLLPLLRQGNRTAAEVLVKKTYATDEQQASWITSLIGYANEIETEPNEPAQQPAQMAAASGKASKLNSGKVQGQGEDAAQ